MRTLLQRSSVAKGSSNQAGDSNSAKTDLIKKNFSVDHPTTHDFDFGKMHMYPVKVQPKLTVNQPDDPYEREADTIADEVMRMPETSSIQHKSPGLSSDNKNQINLKPLARQVRPFIQSDNDGSVNVSDPVSGRIRSTIGNGNRMTGDTKNFMENRFGIDFSDVKIHTGNEASTLNSKLNAKAFTVGKDIYFNDNQYDPSSVGGKRLLAHELTHTLQQSKSDPLGSSAIIRRTPADDAKASAKAIHDALSGAKPNVADALTALSALGRDETKVALLKTTYKKVYKGNLETIIKSKTKGADRSKALFLINAPPAETTLTTEATEKAAGTEVLAAKVGGGDLSVHTDVDYDPPGGGATRQGGFSVGFTGAKSSETRFIQTIWSEIIATSPDKHHHDQDKWVHKEGLPTTNGTMALTTDPKKPKYKIDSGSKTSPFYETSGRNNRTAAGNVDYDRPSEFDNIILKQFDAGATKVVERDHFDNFLIQEENVLYQTSLYVEWVYTTRTTIARTNHYVSGSAITALPADVKKELVKEYPKFDYIS